jgi:hypothetical protein
VQFLAEFQTDLSICGSLRAGQYAISVIYYILKEEQNKNKEAL